MFRNVRIPVRSLRLIVVLAAYAGLFAMPRDVGAAVTRVGAALLVSAGAVGQIHPDIAYDDKHSAYLVVWGDGAGGSNRPAFAQLVTRDGGLIGTKLNLVSCPAGTAELYGQWPRAAYSSGTTDDVFLVVYKQICGKVIQQYAQLLRYSASGIVNLGRVAIRNGGNTGQVVYNPQRGEFVTVWDEYAAATGYDPYYRVITLARDGSGVAGFGALPPATPIALVPNAQGVPTAAYDPNSQSYFFTMQGSDPAAPEATAKNVLLARTLDANTGLMSPIIYVEKGGYPVEASAVYLPDSNQFEVFYRQTNGTDSGDIMARRYAPLSGTPIGTSAAALVRPGPTGATGAGYDAGSHRAMVAAMANDYYVWASEISASGDDVSTFRASSGIPALPGGGTFFPRVVGTGSGFFGLIYGLNYKTVYLDRFTADGSGAPPPPPPPPPPPTSQPLVGIDAPVGGSVLSQPFTLSGWAIDRGAASGTGVGFVDVWAYPNPGSNQAPILVGHATYGGGRTDISGLYGAQFLNSAYSLSVTGLQNGTYNLVIYAADTVTNSWATKSVTVGIKGPLMSLESPVQDTSGPGPMYISGWAVDFAATSGTGVDRVDVWAFPNPGSNQAPFFAGTAAYGLPRADVQALAAKPQFVNAGFLLSVTSLTAGPYQLAVYAHSSVSNDWTNVRVANVTIASGPNMAVDAPLNNVAVTSQFMLGGWAIDLRAPSGTGVNRVDVWAYPLAGGAATFLGSASLGNVRNDVANVFGARAATSGFNLTTVNPLAPGRYLLYISAFSTFTNSFNNVATRVVTVQ